MSGIIIKNSGMLGERVSELMDSNNPIVKMAKAYVAKASGGVVLEECLNDPTILEVNLAVVKIEIGKYLASISYLGTSAKTWDRCYITNSDNKTLFCTDFEEQTELEIAENIIHELRSDCSIIV